MKDLVLDASVMLKWFSRAEERYDEHARVLYARFAEGHVRLLAPRLLELEILNAAARGWRWTQQQLAELIEGLDLLRIRYVDPPLLDVARWTAHELTSYDAAYVAVAEAAGVELVTEDRQILAVAPGIARPLAGAA